MDTVRSSDGTEIAYEQTGAGPPLLFVNGALADHTAGAALADRLEPHVSVMVFDRRGRGSSGNTMPYSPDREVDDIAALLDRLGEPAGVFAHSSGATLALRALATGLPVRAAVVNEPPFIVDDERPRPPANLARRLESLVATGDPDEAVRTFLREGPGLPDATIDLLGSDPAWADWVSLAHTVAFDAMITGDCTLPREQFAELSTPVLVLRGGTSPGWMRSGTDALAAALPRAELREIEGHGHGSPSTAPDLVAREVIRFLAE